MRGNKKIQPITKRKKSVDTDTDMTEILELAGDNKKQIYLRI